MSDNDDDVTWVQPPSPPAPLFLGKSERDLVKQLNDEIIERVVGQTVAYYPISQKHTNYHPLYGESMDKTFLPPVRVFALVEWEGLQTETTNYGVDKNASITINFHKRRLTEDQDLYVREGDFVLYGDHYYEIVTISEPRELFGRNEHRFEISAKAIRARESLFMKPEPTSLTRLRQRENSIVRPGGAIEPKTVIINNTIVDIGISFTGDNSIITLCPVTGTVDHVVLQEYAASPENYYGKVIYVTTPSSSVSVSPFTDDGNSHFWFNERGVWFQSPFVVSPEQTLTESCSSDVSGTVLILSSDENGVNYSDFQGAISGTLEGDIIYLTATGSSSPSPFDEVDKYYFKSGDQSWYKSPF